VGLVGLVAPGNFTISLARIEAVELAGAAAKAFRRPSTNPGAAPLENASSPPCREEMAAEWGYNAAVHINALTGHVRHRGKEYGELSHIFGCLSTSLWNQSQLVTGPRAVDLFTQSFEIVFLRQLAHV
jgi:hypothetical protein